MESDFSGDLSILSRLAKGEGRIGLLVLSGGTRGVNGSAQASVFEARGLANNFTALCGISSGAGVVLYLAAGTLCRGTRIYYEECTTPAFISFTPSRLLQGNAMDLDYLAAVFRGEEGRNAVSLSALRTYKGDVAVGVTNYETGEGEFLNLKALVDPITAVIASMAAPVAYRKPLYVQGKRYLDGIGGMTFPSRQTVERWELDGLIVLANRPRILRRTYTRILGEALVPRTLPPVLRKVAQDRHARFASGIRYLEAGTTPYLIVWAQDEFEMFHQDSDKLKSVAEREKARMNELFLRAGVP